MPVVLNSFCDSLVSFFLYETKKLDKTRFQRRPVQATFDRPLRKRFVALGGTFRGILGATDGYSFFLALTRLKSPYPTAKNGVFGSVVGGWVGGQLWQWALKVQIKPSSS